MAWNTLIRKSVFLRLGLLESDIGLILKLVREVKKIEKEEEEVSVV